MHGETRLTVELQAQEWNTVMAAMAERPYREVAAVIMQIQQQCMAQAAEAEGPGSEMAQVQQFPRAVTGENKDDIVA